MFAALRKLVTRHPAEESPLKKFQPDIAPDMWKLEQYKRQLLFVVGDETERDLAAEASFVPLPVHPTCYTESKYTFWKKDLGDNSYPVPLPENYRPTGYVRWPVEPARIKGELWSIRPSQFIMLDSHKQNGIQFRRHRVKIILPVRDVGWKNKNCPIITADYVRATVPAWLYIGINDYWDAQIGGIFAGAQLDVSEQNRKHAPQYYKFEGR